MALQTTQQIVSGRVTPVAPTVVQQPAPVVKQPTVTQPPVVAPTPTIELLVAKNSETFNNIKAKNKASAIVEKPVVFKPEPDIKITHMTKDKSTLYGTDLTTGNPVRLDLHPNPRSLKPGETFVTISDVTNLKKPILLRNLDIKGQVIESAVSAPSK